MNNSAWTIYIVPSNSQKGASQVAQCRRFRFSPWVGENPLEEEMATHSSIQAWEIPWTEEPGGLQFMGLQKSRIQFSDYMTKQQYKKKKKLCKALRESRDWINRNPRLQGCESDCGQWSSKCVRASSIQVTMVAKMQALKSKHPEVSPDSTDLTWITWDPAGPLTYLVNMGYPEDHQKMWCSKTPSHL